MKPQQFGDFRHDQGRQLLPVAWTLTLLGVVILLIGAAWGIISEQQLLSKISIKLPQNQLTEFRLHTEGIMAWLTGTGGLTGVLGLLTLSYFNRRTIKRYTALIAAVDEETLVALTTSPESQNLTLQLAREELKLRKTRLVQA